MSYLAVRKPTLGHSADRDLVLLIDANHCALSYFIKRSFVVGLGPKAQPSTSVGFELGIIRSGVELVTHCTFSNFAK